nr:hypothetical protein [uncultured Sphaerochaeta sp.]
MLVTIPFCLAQPNPIDDGCMIEFITDDRVFFSPNNGSNRAPLASKQEEKRMVSSVCKNALTRLFQLLVNLLGPTDETDRGKSVPPSVHGILCGFDNLCTVG